jgi:hypothetical protein
MLGKVDPEIDRAHIGVIANDGAVALVGAGPRERRARRPEKTEGESHEEPEDSRE